MTQLLLLQVQIGFMVLALLALRFAMKKLPKFYSYILWLLIFIRLLCPISFESKLGILPSNEESTRWIQEKMDAEALVFGEQPIGEEQAGAEEISALLEEMRLDQFAGGESKPDTLAQIKPESPAQGVTAGLPEEKPGRTADKGVPVMVGICLLWLAGFAGILGYNGWALARIRKKLHSAQREGENVYVSQEVSAPFTLGIRKPRIYLPAFLGSDEREYILCHERVHIRRKDYLIKDIAFLLTCIYWFNPFVWIAFYMLERDMEMSCDEAVVKALGGGIKKQYSQSLLDFAAGYEKRAVTPLTFSEVSVKQRVKNVLSYKGTKKWIGIVGVLILLAAGIFLFTTRETKPEPVNEHGMAARYRSTPEILLDRWAQAMKDKDERLLKVLSDEPEVLSEWRLSEWQFAYYEGYEIFYEEGAKEAIIRYQVSEQDGVVYCVEETVEILKKDEQYFAKHKEWNSYEEINTYEKFTYVYGEGPEYHFTNYTSAFWVQVFRQILQQNDKEHYDRYQVPVQCAELMLHLSGGSGEVTYDENGHEPGARSVVTYTFATGESVEIPMYIVEPSEGIWAPYTEGGTTFEVYEEIPGGDSIKYQATNFGIYQEALGILSCLYPYYPGTEPQMTLKLSEDRLYFRTDSDYEDGDLDWVYNCDMYIDLKTGEVQICEEESVPNNGQNQPEAEGKAQALEAFAKDFINLFNGAIADGEDVSLETYIDNPNLLLFANRMIHLTQRQVAAGKSLVSYGGNNQFGEIEVLELKKNLFYLKVPFQHGGSGMTCQLLIDCEKENPQIVDFYFGVKDGVDTYATGHPADRRIDNPDLWNEEDWVAEVSEKLDELEAELSLVIPFWGSGYEEIKSWGKPEKVEPIEDERVITLYAYLVRAEYPGAEILFNTKEDFDLASGSIMAVTITGKGYATPDGLSVGCAKEELMKLYGLKEADFLSGAEMEEEYRIMMTEAVPEYDSFCVVKEEDNPVAWIYLIKAEKVNAILVRHLTAG